MSDDIKYNDLQELYDDVNLGSEIEFQYSTKKYSITHSSQGVHITEFYNESSERVFDCIEDAAYSYKISGKYLKDIIKDIEIIYIY